MNVGNIKSNLYVQISNNLSLYKFDFMHPHGRHLAFTVNMLKKKLKRGRTSHLLFALFPILQRFL